MSQQFAKQFYNTHRWKACRNNYIQKRLLIDGGLCEECREQQNIDAVDVVLNEQNLEYVCKDCHDAFEGHGSGGHGKAKTLCTFDIFGNPISSRAIDKGRGEPDGAGIPPYSRPEGNPPKTDRPDCSNP